MKKKKIILLLFLIAGKVGYSQNINRSTPITLPEAPNTTFVVEPGPPVSINSSQSVTLLPGTHFKEGSSVSIKIKSVQIVVPPPLDPFEDRTRNWVQTWTYDEDENLTGESKSFFDNNGKPIQSQVKSMSTGHVIASQAIYDAEGRSAVSTLLAPTNNGEFKFKGNFVSNSAGTEYNHTNFDLEKTNLPDAVGNNAIGTLGWYYSNNNSMESLVPQTNYPYSRTDFYKDGTGAAKRSASVGDVLRMGTGKEISSNSFPVVNELNFYKQVRDKFFPETIVGASENISGHALQQISIDENGKQAIAITDLTGKVLMTARGSDQGELTVTNTVELSRIDHQYKFELEADDFTINTRQFVQVHNETTGISQMIVGNQFDPTTMGLYKITSDFPFTITGGVNNVYDDTPARIPEPEKSTIHYFQLMQPSVFPGGYQLIDMATETEIQNLNAPLAPGFYKAISTVHFDATVSYTNKFSDISFNFYNQLGQVIATVAPEGVKKLIENINSYTTASDIPFVSLNEYDLQGRLIATRSPEPSLPDANRSEFVYRKDGNIRFSQNAEQRKTGHHSYTNYDNLGRPIESGEYIKGSAGVSFATVKSSETIQESVEADGGLTDGSRVSWVKTHYDLPDNSHGLSTYVQDEHFLKSGVSWTENANAKTWYNYDAQGRVLWTIKHINGLSTKKTVDYSYDAKGNVIKVDYQKDTQTERFTHTYEYDADNRLSVVYTSASGAAPKEQARYHYYLHGPLKRVELAENLQGIDYTYTPQGWLKAINHPDNAKDPGLDGANGFAPDAFGMTLEYFNGDYVRGNTGISSLATGTNKAYHNGTIVAQSWKSQKTQAVVTANPGINNPAMFTYEYDDKYQFNNNKYGTPNFGTNSFTEALNTNREHNLTYDANGNIKSLGRTNVSGATTNNFGYNYLDKTNKLSSVTNVDNSTTYASYSYDDLGQMISQTKGAAGMYLDYDVSGKVTAIYSDATKTQLKVSFLYDEGGMRIRKTDHVQNVITYYVYDASGNVLAIYDNNGTTLQQKEIPVYASGRIASYSKLNNAYQYELTDHLGNVRVVINENKTASGQADVVYYSDYYPFGSPMTLASNDYRYGYQGQFAEVDKETGFNNFELRMYDPVIGRWMSTDPYGQYASPYVGMGNNPVMGVDPDGGFNILKGFLAWAGGGFKGSLKYQEGRNHENGDWYISKQGSGPLMNSDGSVNIYGESRNFGHNVEKWDTSSWDNFLYGKGAPGVNYNGVAFWRLNWPGPGSDTEHPRDLRRRGQRIIDEVDRAAYQHDITYFERRASGVSGALFNTDPQVIAADARLARAAGDILQRAENGGIDSVTLKPISPRTVTAAMLVHAAFSTIVVSKKLDSKVGF